MTGGALYRREIEITRAIAVRVPMVGEIVGHLEDYYALAALVAATPSDLLVQLDDIGVDWSKLGDFELFCMLWPEVREKQRRNPEVFSLVFGDLDVSELEVAEIPGAGRLVIQDPGETIVIDAIVHNRICEALRMVLGLKKNVRAPGNEAARGFILEDERRRQRRAARGQKNPAALTQLENAVVSLVNTADFPYDFEGVLGLTILQFNESLRQVARKYAADKLYIGVYAGTVDAKKLDNDDLTWMKTGEDSTL